jgi:multiple sugar transport system substrate-binding protein
MFYLIIMLFERGIMRRYYLYSLLFLLIGLGGVLPIEVFATEAALNVALFARSGYQPKDYERITQLFTEISGIPVTISYINYEKQLEEINKSTSAIHPVHDIVAIDALWLPELINKGTILPLNDFIKGFKNDMVSSVLTAFTVGEKTWAMPHLVNFQLLFYNKTLLTEAGFDKAPETLEEMLTQMRVLKNRGTVEYPWHDSWGMGTGLIDEYIWLTGAFGGTLFSPSGEPLFNKGAGLEALRFMIQLLDNKLINPSSLTSGVLETKDEFITANCVFSTNWVFQAAVMKDTTFSKVSATADIALLPVARKILQKKQYEFNSASVGAFQGLAITANASNPERAWKLVRFLTSPLVQKAFPQEVSLWNSLQTVDPTLRLLDPQLELKRKELLSIIQPARIANYKEFSSIIEKHLVSALKKETEPDLALNRAVDEIKAKGISTVVLPSSSKTN